MAEQHAGFARVQDIALVGCRRRSRRGPLSKSGPFRMQTLLDHVPDTVCHHVARGTAVHDDAAFRFVLRQRAIGRAQGFMKFDSFRLEPVGGAFAAPARGARETDSCRHVEDEGEVGFGGTDRDPLEAADQARVDFAQDALIDPGGNR